MAKKIELSERTTIRLDGLSHPISFGEDFHPNDEYNIAPYVFLNEKGKKSDGCVFEIKPHGSTRIMKITDPNFTCQWIAIKGDGWFLGVDPDGEVVQHKLDSNREENPLIELGQGWVDCLIAGDKGIDVIDVSTPPFNLNMETQIAIDDPNLPLKFWKIYKELKQIKP